MGNLYLTRHGQTTANLTGSIVGITDVGLTEKGFLEAHNLGENISGKIDLIITSPQLRAIKTSEIIRKYNNIPIIEHPFLHPQNFGIIEGLTLEEARNKGLGEYLHTPKTNKFLHKALNGESAKEMQERILPNINNIINFSKNSNLNILLMLHNSILRCLNGNFNNIPTEIWLNSHIGNSEILTFENGKINSNLSLDFNSNIEKILEKNLKENTFFSNNFLNNFSILSLNEEEKVLKYLIENNFLDLNIQNYIINILKNTINLNNISNEIKELCKVNGVYSVLQFGSSIYGKNYSITKNTDLDIEIIFDENFNISDLKENLFFSYNGNLEKDFYDFLESKADYFSFKINYKGRIIDFRLTHKNCFDKICNNSLNPSDEYIMKEFRKQFRQNGLVPGRKNFDGKESTWENEIIFNDFGQIINYTLFKYNNGLFEYGNNLDKYCSFTDTFLNEVEVKKKLFNLRQNFLKIFNKEKNKNLISENSSISDIFIRKNKFPNYLVDDLENRYNLYNNLKICTK